MRNLGVDQRGHSTLRRLRHSTDRAPALLTPSPEGESWWCEACVRRTLQAIEESSQAPDSLIPA